MTFALMQKGGKMAEYIVEAETLNELIDGSYVVGNELIRCKDCKYNSNPPEYGNAVCDTFYGMTDQNGFCHMAERREE